MRFGAAALDAFREEQNLWEKYPFHEGCIFLFNFQSTSLVFLLFVFLLSIEKQVDTQLCDRLQGKHGDTADRGLLSLGLSPMGKEKLSFHCPVPHEGG